MLRVGFNLLLAASVIFSSQALAETQLFKPLAEAKVDEKANKDTGGNRCTNSHFSHRSECATGHIYQPE